MAPISEKHYEARIIERRDISEDLWVFRVDPGGEFRFVAGQYATIGLQRDGKQLERAYSIAASPYEDFLEFFVELVPDGEMTPHLHKLKAGDPLSCRRIAKGRFTLDLKSGRKNHLLLSTVTGVVPFISYARTLFRDWKNGGMPGDHRLYILQGASRSQEFGYREELEKCAAEAPWLKYVPTVSRPWNDPAWTGETGRVDDILRKYASRWDLRPDNTSAYLCGHPSMVEHARGILERAGWKKDAIKDEVYFVPGKHPEAGAE